MKIIRIIVLVFGLTFVNQVAAQENDEYVDWLVAEYWYSDFKEGILTTNKEDLKRFVVTGSTIDKLLIGEFAVVNNAGIYYEGIDNVFDDIDNPASIVIQIGDEIVLGAKGLEFSFRRQDDYIIIQHWNGELGCSYSSWWFSFSQTQIEFVGSEYLDYESQEKCTR